MKGYSRPIEAIKIEDIGLGAFYYFASVAIIRIMNYVGYGRTPDELTTFFGVMVLSMVLLRDACALLPPVRTCLTRHVEPVIGAGAVLAVLVACLSMIPSLGLPFFYLSALLTGLACSTMSIGLTNTLSFKLLRSSSFCIPSALAIAVIFYFVYRIFGLFSLIVADGWLISAPLIGMVSFLVAYAPDFSSSEVEQPEKRSFLLLGITAAVFAAGCGLIVYFSGYPDSTDHAQFTLMIPLELLGASVIAAICTGFFHLAKRQPQQSFSLSIIEVTAIIVPPLLLGGVSGTVEVPGGQAGVLWEASIWVLLVAVFAYDMRTSLYAMKGIAIGLMFEAWCIGQMLAKVMLPTLDSPLLVTAVVALGLCYVASVIGQIVVPAQYSPDSGYEPDKHPAIKMQHKRDQDDQSNQAIGERDSDRTEATLQQACIRLGQQHRLTSRENEVLCLIAKGRTAKYISDDLTVSYNTARSHIRHVYEKLDIHSKQEIISLIESIREKA